MHLLRRLRRYLPGKRDLSGRYAVSDRSGRLHRLRRLRRRLPRRRDQAGRVIQTKAKQAARGVAPRKLCFFRGYSSSGRALEWHSRGGRFESVYLHQSKPKTNHSQVKVVLGFFLFSFHCILFKVSRKRYQFQIKNSYKMALKLRVCRIENTGGSPSGSAANARSRAL